MAMPHRVTPTTAVDVLLDDVDLDMVAALQIAPRAPIAAVAAILDMPTTTVSRRLKRLVDAQQLRVIGRFAWELVTSDNPFELWIATEPGRSSDVARGLLAFPEAQFVAQTTGETDIFSTLIPLHGSDPYTLLTEQIPAIDGVASVESRLILESAVVGQSWRLPRLTEEQHRALDEHAVHPSLDAVTSLDQLSDVEFETMKLLGADGRMTAADVARTLDVSSSTAFRAVHRLLETGAIVPRVEVEPSAVGYPLLGFVSVECDPSQVDAILTALQAHPSARMLSMVTGAAAVSFHGLYTGPEDFARFLREDMGAIEGIRSTRSSVCLRVNRRYWMDRSGQQISDQVPDILRR